jgi:hypothetical protein
MKPTMIIASLALALLSTPAFAASGGPAPTYGCAPDPMTGAISHKTCADWYDAMILREANVASRTP